jgi:hypothetical protein
MELIMHPLVKFVQLVKVDEATHRAYGIATSEVPDKDGEICDYTDTVPGYKVWSTEAYSSTTSAGQEPSLGNIRLQHGLEIAGKVTKLEFKDAEKQIWLESEPVSDEIWKMLSGGFIRGYSQGGSYLYRKCDECKKDIEGRGNFCKNCKKDVLVRYASKPSEVSYVDNPCLGEAHFAYVKSDGSLELRKFTQAVIPPETTDPSTTIWPPPLNDADKREIAERLRKSLEIPMIKEAKTKRKAGEDLPASAFLIVGDKDDTSTWHLPVKFSTEEKTKSHLRNALARFNQVKGVSAEVKAKAWKRLLTLCRKHGIDVSEEEKTMSVGDVKKSKLKKGLYQVSMLAEMLGSIRYLQSMSMDEAIWEDDVRDEIMAERFKNWLKDGVEILIDLVEEETSELTAAAKAEKGVVMEENELTKAAKGLSGHFKKAAAHHEKMAEHHKAHAEEHEGMAEEHKEMMEHHAKCMGKADVGDEHKVAHGFHKAMHGHHLKKVSHHEKMHKSHSAMVEECGKASVGCEEAAKVAGVTVPPVSEDEATKAARIAAEKVEADKVAKAAADKAVEEKAAADKIKADELAKAAGAGNEGLAKLFTETLAKMEEKFDKKFEEMGKQIEPLPKGFGLVPRAGDMVKSAASSDNGSGL